YRYTRSVLGQFDGFLDLEPGVRVCLTAHADVALSTCGTLCQYVIRAAVEDGVRWTRPMVTQPPPLRSRPNLLASIIQPLTCPLARGDRTKQSFVVEKKRIAAQFDRHHAATQFGCNIHRQKTAFQNTCQPS